MLIAEIFNTIAWHGMASNQQTFILILLQHNLT